MNWEYITADLETNGLRPSTIFMVGVQDLMSGEYRSYVGLEQVAEAIYYMSTESKMIVGHNFVKYDAKVCKDLGGADIPVENILDTLDMSRALCILRNHKLETWGEMIGLPKLKAPLFENYSPEMDVYCERDVRLNTAAFGFMYRLFQGADQFTHKFNTTLLRDHKDALAKSIIA